MRHLLILPLMLSLLAACPASKRGDAAQDANSTEDAEPFTEDHAKAQQPNRLPPAPEAQAPANPNAAHNGNTVVRSPSMKVVK